jgi:hypothetical protein
MTKKNRVLVLASVWCGAIALTVAVVWYRSRLPVIELAGEFTLLAVVASRVGVAAVYASQVRPRSWIETSGEVEP